MRWTKYSQQLIPARGRHTEEEKTKILKDPIE